MPGGMESIQEEACARAGRICRRARGDGASRRSERGWGGVKGRVAAAVSAPTKRSRWLASWKRRRLPSGTPVEAAPADRQRQAERQQREAEWAALVDAADDQLQFVREWMRDTVQRVKEQMEPGDSVTDSAADAPAGQQGMLGSGPWPPGKSLPRDATPAHGLCNVDHLPPRAAVNDLQQGHA